VPRLAHPLAAAFACAAALTLPAAAAAQVSEVPRASTLAHGWEMRQEPAKPGDPQQAPPEETAPENAPPSAPPLIPPAHAAQAPETWRSVQVPSVFTSRAVARQYAGQVRRYRLTFTGPQTPLGFGWLIQFEQVRRAARVYLNGKLVGGNRDPYTPFTLPARGLKPGKRNNLVVIVDNRKDPKLPEGWWNWGGIVRPVRLIPVGHAYLRDLGTMSDVHCRRPARSCKASLVIDGVLERRGGPRIDPRLTVRLRAPAPGSRVVQKTFKFAKQRAPRRAIKLSLKVPGPTLWAPERPALYDARFTLRDAGRVVQVQRRRVGLRSVQVKQHGIYLNNRRLNLRGASIHEDMPGHGAALSEGDLNQIVHDLQAVHANVTRAHYLLSDRLLSKLDRAGIMVWNETPVWQRDHGANLLGKPRERQRALLELRRTVKTGRNHPSVITHSVANELSFTPDSKPGTKLYLTEAAQWARRIDPTLPIAVDIKSRLGIPEQFTYQDFDILGINQYFGWYSWTENFDDLEPYLREMHDLYPSRALVMTEFGAEALPEMADAATDQKGSYAFQAFHAGRTIDLVDRLPFMSGAIYWTLREFEIYPGWTGGAPRTRDADGSPNTRHHKGLLTYAGDPKPAWYVVRDHYAATPLYAPVAAARKRATRR
jgi:beta-glucuronidase